MRKIKEGTLLPLSPTPSPPQKKDGKLKKKMKRELYDVLNNIFASVFNGNTFFHTSQVSGMQEGDWGSKVLPTVIEEQ